MVKKSIYPVILIILFCSLSLGLGDKILFAKSGIERIISFVIIFGAIPFCIYKTLSLFIKKKWASNLTAISILILGILFGLWSKYISQNDFQKYGFIAHGKVITREWSTIKLHGRWTISAEFTYNFKRYKTFSKNDLENKYRIGDKIRVRFSTRNPENNELILE